MKESINNIVSVCKEHASKPDEELAKKDPKSFIGHFVKKGFSVEGPKGFLLEHMWVHIKSISDIGLMGVLDNDPVMKTTLRCGDVVTVLMNEIEGFLE